MEFVLIDKLLHLSDSQVVAENIFHQEDPVFRDHFPGMGIVPGSLLLEGMAQSCGWWISWKSGNLSKSVLLMADDLRFRYFVMPGQLIRYEGKPRASGTGRARFEVKAWVGEKLVAEAELSFAVFVLGQTGGPFTDVRLLREWMEEKFRLLGGPTAVENLS